MRFWRLVLLFAFAPWASSATFIWSGAGGDGLYSNPANWEGGVAPTNHHSTVVVFRDQGAGLVKIGSTVAIGQIRFETSSGTGYNFSATSFLGSITLDEGIATSNAAGSARFDGSIVFNLSNHETFAINSGSIDIAGSILGVGPVTKTGSGNLKLSGLNLWSGGLNHVDGSVTVNSLAGLGLGTLRLSGGTLNLGHSSGWVGNPVVFEASTQISSLGERPVFFTGPVTLSESVTLTATAGSGFVFSGTVTETGAARKLTVTGLAPVVLAGPNSYSGGTMVQNGSLVFAQPSSIPSNGKIEATPLGYVGIGFTNGVQSNFVDRLSQSGFQGIVGFDTIPGASGTTRFDEQIDLTGVGAYASVGSKTSAILSGIVKVDNGADYKFGGGGGTITLESNLTARGNNLDVTSPFGDPLTLILQGTNTFTGSVNVLASVLVLDGKHALRSATPLNLKGPGYVGITERAEMSARDFLGRLNSIASGDAIAGIDSHNRQVNRTFSEAIDLSLGGTRTNPYYLGTSSRVTLTGTLTPTVGDSLYLTAVKGGYLRVQSALGANIPGLVVGQANSFDPQGGTVEIARANTYSGGTQVLGGTLKITATGALGTGGVTVGNRATLLVEDGTTLANPLSLSSGARLSGGGHLATPGGLTVAYGAILSPGGFGQIGDLNFSTGLTLGSGGILEFDIAKVLGTGSADTIRVTGGALTLSATAASPFTISIFSVDAVGNNAALFGFDSSQSYSWQLFSANDIIGFSSSQFAFDTSGFLNSTGAGGFFVSQSGDRLMLNFTPVPEPSTYVLMAVGVLVLAACEYRRRRG